LFFTCSRIRILGVDWFFLKQLGILVALTEDEWNAEIKKMIAVNKEISKLLHVIIACQNVCSLAFQTFVLVRRH
jgi:hypothetical protein